MTASGVIAGPDAAGAAIPSSLKSNLKIFFPPDFILIWTRMVFNYQDSIFRFWAGNGGTVLGNSTISPEKQKALREKMGRLGISEKDIAEKFVRSRGKGGQKVNKTSSCVYLKHLPTGIEVKCQRERYQALNRFLARRLLVDKIERSILGRIAEEEQRIQKIRRQKRKRSKRAKEKILQDKKLHSRKKSLRSAKISPDE
jgi:hypothetical protein